MGSAVCSEFSCRFEALGHRLSRLRASFFEPTGFHEQHASLFFGGSSQAKIMGATLNPDPYHDSSCRVQAHRSWG